MRVALRPSPLPRGLGKRIPAAYGTSWRPFTRRILALFNVSGFDSGTSLVTRWPKPSNRYGSAVERRLRVRLHAARSRVAAKDGLFSFGGIRTNAGHKIRHKSRQLVEAIAFETETLPSLKAGNFGIYSAFCTYRDFRLSKDMPDDLMEMLVIGQLSYDLSDVSDEVMEMFLETQRRLLPQPIWGTGIDVSKSDATRILGEGMRKLPREKRVQFVLMNGMHNSGLFLPLAAITGCIDFEQYVQYMNQGSPPDSGEEQDRRKQVAFIALYGAIAANRPHPF